MGTNAFHVVLQADLADSRRYLELNIRFSLGLRQTNTSSNQMHESLAPYLQEGLNLVWIHSTAIFDDNLMDGWLATPVGGADGTVAIDFSIATNTHEGIVVSRGLVSKNHTLFSRLHR